MRFTLIFFYKILFYKKVSLIFTEKLRDVLQEREGTSLNYSKVFLNYMGQFSQSISVYLALSYFILVYFGLS